MSDIYRAHAELGRRSLIFDRLSIYVRRGRMPSFEALDRLLIDPDPSGDEWRIRELEPDPGEAILVRSGDGGDTRVTYGSEECDRLVKVYGDYMTWRPAAPKDILTEDTSSDLGGLS